MSHQLTPHRLFIAVLVLCTVAMFSCDKGEEEQPPGTDVRVMVKETIIKDVRVDFAIVESSFVQNVPAQEFYDFGFLLSKTAGANVDNATVISHLPTNATIPLKTAGETLTDTLRDLQKETTYFIRSFAIDINHTVVYGTEATFKTLAGNNFDFAVMKPYPGPVMYAGSIVQVNADLIFAGGVQYTSRTGEKDVPNKEVYKYNLDEDKWTRLPDFPGKRIAIAPFVAIGTKAYIVNDVDQETWEFDLQTNKWTRKADFPSTGELMEYFALNGKMYTGLSADVTLYKELWSYDPASDKWTKLPDSSLSYAMRKELFIANGKAYAYVGNTPGGGIYEFNPNDNTWALITVFPSKIPAPGGTDLSEYSFVLGSKLYLSPGKPLNESLELWSYDFTAGQWNKVQPTGFGSAGGWVRAFVHKGRVYFVSETTFRVYIP